MLRRLGYVAALLMLLPATAQGQQASVGVYARVVAKVETQQLVSSSAAAGGMPSSWLWEVRAVSAVGSPWAAPVLAAGRGQEGWQAAAGERQPGAVSYLFAPI